ncbi:hypothetical protein B0H16DRAFT_1671227 [Mycena metata]|uniref:Exonuclease domain-containing protein n=1 Tax=Mycena metata TaxID=1033252 RepID=A0AAD7KEN0_9AGAR|nr:hypothetical protein B0H16DRAFT_1671227 [Mycena metata]
MCCLNQVISLSTVSVGVGVGGTTPMLACGQSLLDVFVRPEVNVVDYESKSTGITAADLHSVDSVDFRWLQQHISNLKMNKIIVGHNLWQDLSVLGVTHPAVFTRDVGLYQPFRNAIDSRMKTLGLRRMCWELMGRRCQEGFINPTENARVSMDMYRSRSNEWEAEISSGVWACFLPPDSFSRCYS